MGIGIGVALLADDELIVDVFLAELTTDRLAEASERLLTADDDATDLAEDFEADLDTTDDVAADNDDDAADLAEDCALEVVIAVVDNEAEEDTADPAEDCAIEDEDVVALEYSPDCVPEIESAMALTEDKRTTAEKKVAFIAYPSYERCKE